MLNFLKECGISEDVVKDLYNNYSKGNIYNLNCNQFEVVKIIEYFRDVGIKYIDELLMFNLDVFFLSLEEIQNKFNNYDVLEVVNLINDDYMLIDKILF